MKKISIFLLLLILTFAIYNILYYDNYSIYDIKDITKKQKIVLKNKNDDFTNGIELKIIGNINSKASLYVIENDKIYRVIYLKNRVNIDFKCEWYSNNIILLYDPYGVKSGKLKIYYWFR